MERVAGQRAADGTFPEGTVHRLVQDRLREYAEQVHKFGAAIAGAPSPANANDSEGRNKQLNEVSTTSR